MSLFAGRGPLVAIPALTVAMVIVAVLGPGRERGVRAARLYGGPTLGRSAPSFRLSLSQASRALEAATGSPRVSVLLRAGSREVAWSGAVTDEGSVDIRLPELPGANAFEVTITEGERELGREASRSIERAGRTAQHGAVDGAAPKVMTGGRSCSRRLRGVFAVPFADELLIRVEDASTPVGGAAIELDADGADLSSKSVVTDEHGLARVALTPLEHAVQVRARSKIRDQPVETSTSLPVVPGAIDARVEGGRLVVRSPVPREWAYYALVTLDERVGGGSLRLMLDDQGGSAASAPLPPLPEGPLWAVVSSALDLRSPGRVGWPLRPSAAEPAHTFDVTERLLLDGLPQASRREAARQQRVRWAVVLLCGLALLLELALLAGSAERSRQELERHFQKSGIAVGATRPLIRGPWSIVSAVLAVALGFAVLALFSFFTER